MILEIYLYRNEKGLSDEKGENNKLKDDLFSPPLDILKMIKKRGCKVEHKYFFILFFSAISYIQHFIYLLFI